MHSGNAPSEYIECSKDKNSNSNEWRTRLRQRLVELENSTHGNEQHHATLKRASILILLDSQGNALFNKRSMDLKSHPGEVCFPGGKQDPSDLKNKIIHPDPDVVTALRECHEEVGLQFALSQPSINGMDLPHLEILGRMPTLESKHHLCVTPIIAMVDLHHEDLHLNINISEVDSAFWAPLHFFVENTPKRLIPIKWRNETFWYRDYSYTCKSTHESHGEKQNKKQSKAGVYNITGLTAHVAHELARLVFPINGHTLFRLIEERRPYWSPYYYDFSTNMNMLHQYDHEWHSQRKQHTATKKNRLPLVDCQMVDYEDSHYCHAFQLIALDGRIVWTLAALTLEDKEIFQQKILGPTAK